jgi:methylmalonyl-CoA mutase N-terminal domain/subunit
VDWRKSLDAIGTAARDGSNLLPPVISAIEAYATVGEIADELRRTFGEYVEAPAL